MTSSAEFSHRAGAANGGQRRSESGTRWPNLVWEVSSAAMRCLAVAARRSFYMAAGYDIWRLGMTFDSTSEHQAFSAEPIGAPSGRGTAVQSPTRALGVLECRLRAFLGLFFHDCSTLFEVALWLCLRRCHTHVSGRLHMLATLSRCFLGGGLWFLCMVVV